MFFEWLTTLCFEKWVPTFGTRVCHPETSPCKSLSGIGHLLRKLHPEKTGLRTHFFTIFNVTWAVFKKMGTDFLNLSSMSCRVCPPKIS
jgi:hypothetical protein